MSIIRITTEVIFDYNTETKECTPISQKVINESSVKKADKAKTTTTSNEDNPGIIRENGKLILSEDAINLLGVQADDKIYIGYDKFGTGFKPFIGSDDKKGNKLTKSNTVSYRGKSNDELAYYGDKFKLTPGKHNGTFYLEGDKEVNTSVPEGIEIKEESISDDLSLDLDNINSRKITTFTFNDIDLE